MTFILLDRIVSIEPNKKITATKNLSLGEEYLADHFPGNPVMPGVLQLEAMVQAAAWLLRVSQNFTHSVVVFADGRSIRYGKFVAPGDQLKVEVKLSKIEDGKAWFQGTGSVNGGTAVKGRFSLRFYNLADQNKDLAETDKDLIAGFKRKFRELGGAKLLEEFAG